MGKYNKDKETYFLSDDPIADDGLFADDEDFKRQDEIVKINKMREDAKKFLKVTLQHSCEDCNWRDGEGNCHVMQYYNKNIIFPVVILEKCSHWKKRDDN